MKKYWILSLLVIIFIAFITFIYFYSLWQKDKTNEDEILRKAFRATPTLEEVTDVDYFTGDSQYYIIFGKDKKDRTMLVWIGDKEVRHTYLYEYYTKEQITQKALSIAPNITIKRVNAGMDKNHKLIYEVLYEDNEGRLGYQYFDLRTGEFIKMYRLGKVQD